MHPSRTLLLLALLVGVSLAGCTSESDSFTPAEEESSFFPPRTEARDKPVLMVHGFSFGLGQASSDPAAWSTMRAYLQAQGWGEVLSYGYYGCDQGFDRHVSQHGSHDAIAAVPGSHSEECGPGSHTRETPIQHLAMHFAWAVYDEFSSQRRCVDIVAHSMGGLVVRYAIHGVEVGLAGFPPRLCVEDAVTLGTPHGGAGILGDLCATFLAHYQCRQMVGEDDLLAYLAANAATPQAETGTDWSVLGSRGDQVVSLESAVSMAAHQAVYYLGQTAVSHATGALSFLAADPWTTLHLVRYRDPGGDWLVANDAPAPVAWVDEALVHRTTSSVSGVVPPAPVASRVAPVAAVGVAPGRSVTFEATCSNERQDLDRGEWWVRQGGAWTGRDVDYVQVAADPWTKQRTYTFDAPGSYEIRFRCVNGLESTADVDWSIDVDPSYNDAPTASRVSPNSPIAASTGQSIRFDGTCANPAHDLDRAEWWVLPQGGDWSLRDEDTVQFHDDPWVTGITIPMQSEGTHTVRLRCIDTAGAQSDADWTITVTRPAGPTATRYAPAASTSAYAGDSVTFEAACSNPEGRLDRGEWWVRTPGQDWSLESTDTVQWASDPWEKSRTYTFSNTGDYGVRFRCVNDDGGTGDVDWSVQVY